MNEFAVSESGWFWISSPGSYTQPKVVFGLKHNNPYKGFEPSQRLQLIDQ